MELEAQGELVEIAVELHEPLPLTRLRMATYSPKLVEVRCSKKFGRCRFLRKFGHREDALGPFVMHTRYRRRGLH